MERPRVWLQSPAELPRDRGPKTTPSTLDLRNSDGQPLLSRRRASPIKSNRSLDASVRLPHKRTNPQGRAGPLAGPRRRNLRRRVPGGLGDRASRLECRRSSDPGGPGIDPGTPDLRRLQRRVEHAQSGREERWNRVFAFSAPTRELTRRCVWERRPRTGRIHTGLPSRTTAVGLAATITMSAVGVRLTHGKGGSRGSSRPRRAPASSVTTSDLRP